MIDTDFSVRGLIAADDLQVINTVGHILQFDSVSFFLANCVCFVKTFAGGIIKADETRVSR